MSVGLQAAVGGFLGSAAFYVARILLLRLTIWRVGRALGRRAAAHRLQPAGRPPS